MEAREISAQVSTLQASRRRFLENDGKPSMIGVGRVEGSIEDALYGAYDQTDEELRMTAELVDVDFGDGVVLSNMEQGSQTDPYRYLGIKWILTPFPMKGVMVDRDWILLEPAGIKTDGNGRRYGYHTLFTVELPQVPAFPEVIRGAMWYTFIFRDAGRGMIDVHSQGYMNNYGEIMDFITVIAGAQMLNGVIRYMKSAEAKKLTILALENLERKITMGLQPTIDKAALSAAPCIICSKTKSTIQLRRMHSCRVCDAIVCSSCRVKKNILTGRQRVMSKVSVCHRCIAHAKTLVVESANEKYVISREMQTGGRSHTDSAALTAIETLTNGAHQQHHFGKLKTRGNFYDETDGLTPSDFGDQWGEAHGMNTFSARSESTRSTSAYCQSQYGDPRRSATPRTQSYHEDRENAAEQHALYQKMMELHEAAKHAYDLTQANRFIMEGNARYG